MAHRKNETSRTWFRSERLFRSNAQWFFHTREGIAVGPYQDKFSAEVDAEMLKSSLKGAEPGQARQIIKEFMLESGKTMGGLNDSAFTDYLVDEGVNAFRQPVV